MKRLSTVLFGAALLLAGCFGGNGVSQASVSEGTVEEKVADKLTVEGWGTVRRIVDCDAGVLIYVNSVGIQALPLSDVDTTFAKNKCGISEYGGE